MADYAVINPATGETVKEYPTISDEDLKDAIARADKRSPRVEPRRPRSRSAPRWSAGSESYTASSASGSARSSCARWASRSSRRSARSTSASRSTTYYADNAAEADGRRADRAARGRRLGVHPPQLARRAAGDHAVELPLLPGGPVRRTQPGDRQHDPAQARAAVPGVGRGDGADLPRGRVPRRTPTSTSTRPTTRSRT